MACSSSFTSWSEQGGVDRGVGSSAVFGGLLSGTDGTDLLVDGTDDDFLMSSIAAMDEKVDISSLMEAFEGDANEFLSLDPDSWLKYEDLNPSNTSFSNDVVMGGSGCSSLHSPSSTDGSTHSSAETSPLSSLSGEPSPAYGGGTTVSYCDEVFQSTKYDDEAPLFLKEYNQKMSDSTTSPFFNNLQDSNSNHSEQSLQSGYSSTSRSGNGSPLTNQRNPITFPAYFSTTTRSDDSPINTNYGEKTTVVPEVLNIKRELIESSERACNLVIGRNGRNNYRQLSATKLQTNRQQPSPAIHQSHSNSNLPGKTVRLSAGVTANWEKSRGRKRQYGTGINSETTAVVSASGTAVNTVIQHLPDTGLNSVLDSGSNLVLVLPPSTSVVTNGTYSTLEDVKPLVSYPQILPKQSPTGSRSTTPAVTCTSVPCTTVLSMPPTPGPWTAAEELSRESSCEGGSEFEIKREQRKIRNREAAQQSRQRRKDYLEQLKIELDSTNKEKDKLKRENAKLRESLAQSQELLKECVCRNKSPMLNGISSLPAGVGAMNGNVRPILKKTAFCLAAMMLLLTVNMGPFLRYLPDNISPSSQDHDKAMSLGQLPKAEDLNNFNGGYEVNHFHSRSLMEYSSKEANPDLSNQKKNISLNITSAEKQLTKKAADHLEHEIDVKLRNPRFNNRVPSGPNAESGLNTTILEEECRMLYVNQTESRRLDDQLRSWMEMVDKFQTKKSSPAPFGQTPVGYKKRLDIEKRKNSRKPISKRKTVGTKSSREVANRSAKQFEGPSAFIGPMAWWPEDSNSQKNRNVVGRNGDAQYRLQVFSTPEVLYLKALEKALHRKDDTFYLISFQKDYLLLPAAIRNSTTRPRMSLIVPVLALNESMAKNAEDQHQITMMKIECEVTALGLVDLPDQLVHPPNSTQSGEH